MNCETIRQHVHEAMDAERGGLPDEVREHLVSCAACREFHDELRSLQASLRALPRDPMPPDVLDAVWAQTVRSSRAGSRLRDSWRAAAAAVVVTALGATTLYFVSTPLPPEGPSAAELARAEAQAELVLGYTARALAATREATSRDVIADKVSPAVRGDAPPRAPRRTP
jgi:predicted anti-sigma-YlaC factor YlaD